ncbi:MAG: type III pantothenate kinase [Desulfotalea sp.]
MLLVIDIGNSHTVSGLYKDGELLGSWRLKTNKDYTADELAIRYYGLFKNTLSIEPTKITDIVIASVVPTLTSAWLECCNKHFNAKLSRPAINLNIDNLDFLIKVDTDNPKEVGVDRLVNSYGAWNEWKSNLIIIDFGTAITFDCVTSECVYIGGVILPGIVISLDALASRTAKLPMVDVHDAPKKLIGKNTVDAMKSGILYGYGSMIDGLINGIQKEMEIDHGSQAKVIATGGMAKLIAPFSKQIEHIDQKLTLNAMELIFQKLKGQR